jgi:predicted DNA-binding protein YlxM (UPF0122 family)
MFDNDYNPYDKIEYLEMTLKAMAEALELLAEQQAQTAWLVEQLSEQTTANAQLLNQMVERVNHQQRRIQLLETYHD